MKTLRELICLQDMSFGKMSDLEIIYEWFIRNNKEQEGLDLIPRLAKSQANKIQNKYRYQIVLRIKRQFESEILGKIYQIVDNNKQGNSVFVEINPQNMS